MELEVKKWGNGIAIRLPRERPEYGRLEPGMKIEVQVRVMTRPDKAWEPYTFEGRVPDASQRIDEIAWGYMDNDHE